MANRKIKDTIFLSSIFLSSIFLSSIFLSAIRLEITAKLPSHFLKDAAASAEA